MKRSLLVWSVWRRVPHHIIGQGSLTKLGHEVRLMPSRDVNAYVKRNTNDVADAKAIVLHCFSHGALASRQGTLIGSMSLRVGIANGADSTCQIAAIWLRIPPRIPSKAYLRSLCSGQRSGSFAHDLSQEIWSRTSVDRFVTRPRLLRPAKRPSVRRASRRPRGPRQRRSVSSFGKAVNLVLRKWQRGKSA